MGVLGDGGAGFVGSGATSSVCSASPTGSMSDVISDSISALIVWFGYKFSCLRRIEDWLFKGSSVLGVFLRRLFTRCFDDNRICFCPWVLRGKVPSGVRPWMFRLVAVGELCGQVLPMCAH